MAVKLLNILNKLTKNNPLVSTIALNDTKTRTIIICSNSSTIHSEHAYILVYNFKTWEGEGK